MIVVSHPTGNVNVRAVLRGLDANLQLGGFATTLAIRSSASWLKFVPGALRSELLRRAYPDVRPEGIETWPWRELVRLSAGRLGWESICRHEVGWASIDAIYQSLDRRVAGRLSGWRETCALRGVYAYEDGALATFEAARRLGLRCFYDQPIGHWKAARRILTEEAELQPEWAGTLTGNLDSSQKLARKDNELELADEIFVASTFTHRTLLEAGVSSEKIHVIPYGAPPVMEVGPMEGREPNGALRVLFVGSLGQRKGLSYLLGAVELFGLKNVELTLIGQIAGEICRPLRAALVKHRHVGSLPHAGILAEMRRHDVFVFPSLFEGFGLVLLEAMSQGLPVITTAHTAGPDIVTEGKDGFIVPMRAPEAIAERLELLHCDRDRLREMSNTARRTARRHTWKKYEETIAIAVQRALAA